MSVNEGTVLNLRYY